MTELTQEQLIAIQEEVAKIREKERRAAEEEE